MNSHAAVEAKRRGLLARALEIDRTMMRRTSAHIKNGIGWIHNRLGRGSKWKK